MIKLSKIKKELQDRLCGLEFDIIEIKDPDLKNKYKRNHLIKIINFDKNKCGFNCISVISNEYQVEYNMHNEDSIYILVGD